MSEPAKNEAELLDQVVLATCECQPGGCYLKDGAILCCAEDDKVEAVFAAIRAAGWAVVPVEPTWKMIRVMDNYDDMMQDETTIQLWKDMLAAAPEAKP
jgi:hypothetical protein